MASRALIIFFFLFSTFFVAVSNAQINLNGCPFNKLYTIGSSSPTQASLMASHIHLPPPTPYTPSMAGSDPTLFHYGASFSNPGSTIMPLWFFRKMGIQPSNHTVDKQLEFLYYTVDKQLEFLYEHIGPLCTSQESCIKKLGSALFFFDQLGVNDYKSMFMHGKSILEASKLVPQVTMTIKEKLQTQIVLGVKNLFVSGSPPIGCFPGYRTKFDGTDGSNRGSNKCHDGLNNFAKLHNDHLRQALFEIRRKFPHVRVVYMDYYNAFMALLRNHVALGFEGKTLMKACCGTGGKYNFTPEKQCGDGAPVCSDPSRFIHWDGFGLTQEAVVNMFNTLFSGRKFVYPEYKFPPVHHCVM